MLGDIKISLQPGFSSLMQDLARQPLDDANARLATPATQAPATGQPSPELPAGAFTPAMLPLPPNTMQNVAEPDRRSRNLADVRAAFQAFDEPIDEPAAERSVTSRIHDAARGPAATSAGTLTQQEARPAAAMIHDVRFAPAKGAPAPAQPLQLRAAAPSVRNPMVDQLQASGMAAARTGRPASSQPVLLMFAGAVVSLALAWMMMRFI